MTVFTTPTTVVVTAINAVTGAFPAVTTVGTGKGTPAGRFSLYDESQM